ncbi:unnamed protein product [Periconia digitata]|uniref:chitinase n=1 Tax=Periconia digitata TaxID=1303443 RepID=A0A9W4XJG3_9PLEO|nr:unnamed protein product [Periconia digitata]
MSTAQRVNSISLQECPASCRETQDPTSREGWFLYSDIDMLTVCNKTMLVDMVVQNAQIGDSGKIVTRACTADYDPPVQPEFVNDENKASLCTTANRVLENSSIHLSQPPVDDKGYHTNDLVSAGRQIANHLALQKPSCQQSAIEFAYSQSSAIGVYAGAELHQQGVTALVLEQFLDKAQSSGFSQTTVIQMCGGEGRGADYSLGIVAASAKNFEFVQKTVKSWSNGDCLSASKTEEPWMDVAIRVPEPIEETSGNSTNVTSKVQTEVPNNRQKRATLEIRSDCTTAKVQSGDICSTVAKRCGINTADLQKFNRANICTTLVPDELVCCSSGTLPNTIPPGNADGTCKTREVVSGDLCGSLASKCGISLNDFLQVNTKPNFCNSLFVGQKVCCTAGNFPDLKPKPDDKGNCATYTIKQNDSCSKIAATLDLTVSELETFNKGTWGWNGCNDQFFPDFVMCVSTGNPPMPAVIKVDGTAQPPSGTNLSSLNACALNACCNKWGNCGTTDEFCLLTPSKTGAPGTTGCISNCGRDIVKGSPPATKMKVGYYESWNFDRKCLNMPVTSIPSDYTHIHFAFVSVSASTYKLTIPDERTLKEFEEFKKMKNVKRIISLGGWAFSTEPGTTAIIREGILPENRNTFRDNVVAFLNEHDLDGVDLDWEYPGTAGDNTTPKDALAEGLNYYKFLLSVKLAVKSSSKSVSFAAPASYGYLKAFPINLMARELDYIIFMTYDLHGQWDYGNPWTSSGCSSGNCLRSHVNETETKDALSMITKAGANSGKVVVGVASYGRSFKMEKAGCDSEMCKFTGSSISSDAYKGRCTNSAGYLANAEILEIIQNGNVQKQYVKEGSNILVFNDTEWVAYMDEDMKASRAKFYDSFNFAGTTDWAVDLQKFLD